MNQAAGKLACNQSDVARAHPGAWQVAGKLAFSFGDPRDVLIRAAVDCGQSFDLAVVGSNGSSGLW